MSLFIIPCFNIKSEDCLEHSNFLKVNEDLNHYQKMNSNCDKVKSKINHHFLQFIVTTLN